MRLFHLLWLFILWMKMEKSSQRDEVLCKKPDIQDADIIHNEKESYSNKEQVQFECKNGMEKRFTVTCEQGNWMEIQGCAVIKCRVPVIENGNVPGDTQEYNEHEVLHFECNPNYIPTDRRPTKCTIQGGRAEWIPTPYCETTKCRLTLPPLEGTSYEPAYRNLFSPGDTVKVICGERYGISNLQNTSATVTCNDNGDWTFRPLCIEVTCSNQRDPLLDNWQVQRITLNGTARYTCRSGYRSKDGANMATCTRDGWRPNPLCQEITCDRLNIPNANIVNPKRRYTKNQQADYECKEGYIGRPTRICEENGWTGDSQCTEITCRRRDFETAEIHGNIKPEYNYNERVEYVCKSGYTGRFNLTCGQTGWHGQEQCRENCKVTGVPHSVHVTPTVQNNQVRTGQKLSFTCRYRGQFLRGNAVVECLADGQWSDPFPTCGDPLGCDSPPPLVDGDSKESLQFHYSHSERVEYICQNLYEMEGEPYQTCMNGKWFGTMRCLRPCTVDADAMSRHNIAFKYRRYDKLYAPHNDEIEFRCVIGRPYSTLSMRSRCIDGVMPLPTCR